MDKYNQYRSCFLFVKNKIIYRLLALASVSLLAIACAQSQTPSTASTEDSIPVQERSNLQKQASPPTALPLQEAVTRPPTPNPGAKSMSRATPATPRIISSTTKSPSANLKAATNRQTPPPTLDNRESLTPKPTRGITPSLTTQTNPPVSSDNYRSTPDPTALPTPTNTPVIQRHGGRPHWDASGLSLDLYALRSDFIVLARLVSIGSGTQDRPQ